MNYREVLARRLCLEYPEFGCSAAFDAVDPCHKHQRIYYDLADTVFEVLDEPATRRGRRRDHEYTDEQWQAYADALKQTSVDACHDE